MRLAICDDASVLRDVFARLCRGLGHELAGSYADLDAALAHVGGARPDALVLDGRLVRPLGPAIVALRRASPATAVYLCASIDERDLIVEARAAGAAGAVRRPFAIADLRAAFGTPASQDASRGANANQPGWQKAPS